jgi:hypothetical protein
MSTEAPEIDKEKIDLLCILQDMELQITKIKYELNHLLEVIKRLKAKNDT